MNADTARLHALHEPGAGTMRWPPIGARVEEVPPAEDFAEDVRGEVEELRAAVAAGEPIVVVSADVAHAVALGRRELDRRARRRRAAKQARKRNR